MVALEQSLQHRRIEPWTDLLLEDAAHLAAPALVGPVPTAEANHPHRWCQVPAALEMIEGRQQFDLSQIAGGAENNQGAGFVHAAFSKSFHLCYRNPK
jgi:hypothetical protein